MGQLNYLAILALVAMFYKHLEAGRGNKHQTAAVLAGSAALPPEG